jgi:hypothetical protein
MRKLTLDFEQPANTLESIKNLENNLKITLPNDFINFLFLNSGGFPKECLFPSKQDDMAYIIQFFYTVNSNRDDYSLEKYIKTLHENFMSNHFIPFANDPGGWMYVVSTREKDYNHVYFYRPDEPEDNCLTYLSSSFEGFINNLRSPEELTV